MSDRTYETTTSKKQPGAELACPWCGKTFVQTGGGRRRVWCSDTCRVQASVARRAAAKGKTAIEVVRQDVPTVVEKTVHHVREVRTEAPAQHEARVQIPVTSFDWVEHLALLRSAIDRGQFGTVETERLVLAAREILAAADYQRDYRDSPETAERKIPTLRTGKSMPKPRLDQIVTMGMRVDEFRALYPQELLTQRAGAHVPEILEMRAEIRRALAFQHSWLRRSEWPPAHRAIKVELLMAHWEFLIWEGRKQYRAAMDAKEAGVSAGILPDMTALVNVLTDAEDFFGPDIGRQCPPLYLSYVPPKPGKAFGVK